MRPIPLIAFLMSVALLAACGGPQDDPGTDTAAADSAPSTAGTTAPPAADRGASDMIFNTPEGGLLDWVADIRAGLDSVPALMGSDPSAAQGTVLTLYAMRQEYLEGYYGESARLETTPELSAAIMENEQRFHALMMELAQESPDSATVVTLTDSLEAQTARVRQAAEGTGRELTPWSGEDQ